MDKVTVARLVEAYRTDPETRQDAYAQKVLNGLEADRHGRVLTALVRLGVVPLEVTLQDVEELEEKALYAVPKSVLSYLIQAVDLASSTSKILSETAELAEKFRENAKMAKSLKEFCNSRVSVSLWFPLQKLVEELEEKARFYDQAPKNLLISRKSAAAGAEQTLALRHFSKCLQGMRADCLSTTKRKQATQWLVEAALGYEIPVAKAVEALRPVRRRVSRSKRPNVSPNHCKE